MRSCSAPAQKRALLAASVAVFGIAASSAIAPAAASDRFDVNEIRVDGDTVLSQDKVEETVYPFLGTGKGAADVEAARKALQNEYNREGYLTVSVLPARWLDRKGGIIGLQVLERRVGRLRVTHARYFLPDAIKQGAPSLQPGTVPNMNQVKADLLGLNQWPDRGVQPSLRPGRDPDTVDVDLDVADKLPLHGSLELNNRYNEGTHDLRLNASLTYDNFFQRGDSGTINYSVAPESVKDAEIESASYLFHVPDSKLSILFSYLHSNSDVVALSSTDVAGRGQTAGFRLLVPLSTSADSEGHSFSQSFSFGWDYKRYYELDTFKTNGTFTSAPVTYYPLTGAYTADWAGPKSVTDVSISAEVNLSGFSSSSTTFENKRAYAAPGFSILRATITREQNLPYDLQAWASLQGQLSNDSLVSSEQFGLGGAESIRGYLEAETLGDYGVTLQTELRSPDIHKYVGGPVQSWRFHVFGDVGLDSQNQPAAGTPIYDKLSSVGVGTRVNLWGYLNGSVQDAHVMNTGPNTKAGTDRVLFRVYGEF